MPIFTEPPLSPKYDGRSRDFLVDSATGKLQGVHPVDHKMVMGICTRKGSWKSSPEVGQELHEIQYVGGSSAQTEIERCIRSAVPVAELLANGDVEIRGIAHESIKTGGFVVEVAYVNLRDDPSNVRRVSTRAG